MADYKEGGNRWTAIYVVEHKHGGGETYRKLPFELVRFNVDIDPDAPEEIVPCNQEPAMAKSASLGTDDAGPARPLESKVYEKIWIVDSLPFAAKTSFGPAK